jgi:redox-sensing transcriptional repressor
LSSSATASVWSHGALALSTLLTITSPRPRIPRPTVKRLSFYLRELETLAGSERQTISSKELGSALDLTDAQVRKDLAFFGQFGHPGIGYRVGELIEQLRKILGTDRAWNTAVIGAGNIGRAVMAYQRFQSKGFDMVAILDGDPKVVGTTVAGHRVRPMEDLPMLVRERDVQLVILAVPAPAAQQVADRIIEAGVRGILNFAPIRLEVRGAVSVVSVDLSVSLEQLAFQTSLGMTGSLD